MKLNDKRILITGGTSGIGLELVRQLAEKNALLVIGRNRGKLDALERRHPSVSAWQCDLSNQAELAAFCEQVGAKWHKEFDLLICNAAVQYTPRFTDPDFQPESIEKEIATNFTSVCAITAALLPSLTATRRRSLIVLVNSGLALAPKKASAVYCATKAALRSFGLSLSYQLEDTQTRALQAYLPLVDTPMTQNRGRGQKLTARAAAQEIIAGIEKEKPEFFIGKAKLLAWLHRFSPSLAREIMKGY